MPAPPPPVFTGTDPELVERFCQEYVKDFKGGAAARRAGIGNPATARSWASRLLARPDVAERVLQLKLEVRKRVEVEVDDVLRRLASIAMTDVAELVEYRRCCCRHCWGRGFQYQRTDGELQAARMRHAKDVKAAREAGKDLTDGLPEFDEAGGGGFKFTNDPNPECPECGGEGIGVPFLKDTRDLGPDAAAAYAGVKVTKDGVELKVHDQLRALELLGKHLGMFAEKLDVNMTVTSLANRMRQRVPALPGADLA